MSVPLLFLSFVLGATVPIGRVTTPTTTSGTPASTSAGLDSRIKAVEARTSTHPARILAAEGEIDALQTTSTAHGATLDALLAGSLAVTADGTTTARMLGAHLGDRVNVLDFIPTALHSAIRAGTNSVNLRDYLQTAIDATQGKTLYFPKGLYRVNSTLYIATRSNHWVGDVGVRAANGGTEIMCYGTGPCVQIGSDAAHVGINPETGAVYDWDDNLYDGPQGQTFERLAFRHGAQDTATPAAPTSGAVWKAGAYGIWDWYAGGIILRDVSFERFEASFVGIQSDINLFENVASSYTKWGIYLGPRSDQNTIRFLYTFYSERALTLDRAAHTRVEDAQIVGCGTDTISPIEIRRGSSSGRIVRPWFEHLGDPANYTGTDQKSFVSAGEVNGYGAGGTIDAAGPSSTTASVEGVTITEPFVYTPEAGVAGHTKYIATVGMVNGFRLDSPAPIVGTSLANFDAFVNVPAAQAPTAAQTRISIAGVDSGTAFAKFFTNSGAGTPAVNVNAQGSSGTKVYHSSRVSFIQPNNPAGSEEIRLSTEGQAGQLFVSYPTYATGQTNRVKFTKSVQHCAAMPATGAYEVGDLCINSVPAIVSGKILLGWARLTTGSAHVSGTDWSPMYVTTAP